MRVGWRVEERGGRAGGAQGGGVGAKWKVRERGGGRVLGVGKEGL